MLEVASVVGEGFKKQVELIVILWIFDWIEPFSQPVMNKIVRLTFWWMFTEKLSELEENMQAFGKVYFFKLY